MCWRPWSVKRQKKKKTAGQTLGGTLTCVEQRGKRGPEKRSERGWSLLHPREHHTRQHQIFSLTK